MIKAHDNVVRDLSFSPSTLKFISCSEDTKAKIFDFLTAKEEFQYKGHGSDVKSCDWHPSQCLVVTGSKDNYVKLWDPRSGDDVINLQPHNKSIKSVRFNPINGNWLLTGSDDGSLKVHDLRVMKDFNTF
jgi:polyadenylation factor subunit 2